MTRHRHSLLHMVNSNKYTSTVDGEAMYMAEDREETVEMDETVMITKVTNHICNTNINKH